MIPPMNPYRYPVGIQIFPTIREEGYLYVDKTDLVYKMANGNAKYVFLSRPRRFGKTLLVTTLKAYFEGRKELFEGLAMEVLEKEWTKYPVLHFNMSLNKHLDLGKLERFIANLLSTQEELNGMPVTEGDVNMRLTNLIRRLYEKTGKKVVVLIDEYDAQLLDLMHEEEELPARRNILRNFYSPLKGSEEYLRFVFLTGITKFSQLSIFSELNNIQNISRLKEYASLCGITEEEMLTQMRLGIERLAKELNATYEETVDRLKLTYDGYHFTWPSPDIYNPYSLLRSLEEKKTENYWFDTGTPTYLVEMLRKFEVLPQNIGGQYVRASEFDAPTEMMTDAIPLLYQSGYLTIKDYNQMAEAYLLEIPNKEVRVGLMESLLPEYVTPAYKNKGINTATNMYIAIYEGRMEDAILLLRDFFSCLPYTDNTNYEGHYQNILCAIFTLIGFSNVDIEVRTPSGRADMVLKLKDRIYIFELKFNKSAREAMEQIDIKNYPERFAQYNLPITKVALNFDDKTRNISEWLVE